MYTKLWSLKNYLDDTTRNARGLFNTLDKILTDMDVTEKNLIDRVELIETALLTLDARLKICEENIAELRTNDPTC